MAAVPGVQRLRLDIEIAWVAGYRAAGELRGGTAAVGVVAARGDRTAQNYCETTERDSALHHQPHRMSHPHHDITDSHHTHYYCLLAGWLVVKRH